MPSKDQITAALEKHVPRGTVSGVVIDGGKVGFALESQDEGLRLVCEKAVFAIPGVEKVTAVLTGSRGQIKVDNKNTPVLDRRQSLPGVKKIIAVAAGKGGVGKSTVAVNLAIAAAAAGMKTALVDADIYGPSLPMMMGFAKGKGLRGKGQSSLDPSPLALRPELVDGKMIPLEAHGVACNSIGFLIDEASAAIWRGPMATKAIHQLLLGTKWDTNNQEIDIMFLDLPPGTGDIQLTLAQNYKIDGAVLVTTPQDVAVADVRKAAQMFARVNIPIFGIVENMSYFVDGSGNKNHIFGQGGGEKLASELKTPLLAQIPLDPVLRQNGDSGTPRVGEVFEEIIKELTPRI